MEQLSGVYSCVTISGRLGETGQKYYKAQGLELNMQIGEIMPSNKLERNLYR